MSGPIINAEYVARELGRGTEVRQGDGWVTLCPAHNDNSPSFSVSDGPDGKLLVRCHANCSQTQVIDALKDRGLWPRSSAYSSASWRVLPYAPESVKSIPDDLTHPKFGKPSKRWIYRDARKRLVGAICRFDKEDGGKEVVPLSWNVNDSTGQGRWGWKAFIKPRPLYREDVLAQSPRDWTVLVVEGEKACDAAVEMFPNMVVVSWAGGSKAVRYSDWSQMKNRKIVIWPDADEPGQKAAAMIAEAVLEVGVTSVSIVALPPDLPEGWDLADPVPPGVDLDPKLAIGAATQYTPSGDLAVDEMNRSYAITLMGDKAVVIWERMDPVKKRVVPVYTSASAIGVMLSNRKVQVGKREVPIFDHWMTHEARRTYDAVVFEPGNVPARAYNLWRGFTVMPDANGDWSMLKEHIYQNVAQGDDSLAKWIIGWFAQMLQQPRNKPGTSLAMRGKQGVGKTVVGKHVGHLFRDNYVYIDDPRYVLGNFNSHMGHALLLQADEGFFAGDPRHVGRLKGLITSDTNRIEPKGKESFEIYNYMRLLVTSNSDWIVPTAFEERRFAIVDVGGGQMQNRPFFEAMERQLECGGYEGLLHELLNFDLSTIDVGKIPTTAALMDQKEYSFDPVQRYWFERLRDGNTSTDGVAWLSYVSTEAFYQDFIARCQTWGIYRRPSDTQFLKDLEDLTPAGSFDRVKKSIEVAMESGYSQMKKVWCYKMPKLTEAREFFEKKLGYKQAWPGEDVEVEPLKDTDDRDML